MAGNIMDWWPGPASDASGPYLSTRGSSRGNTWGSGENSYPQAFLVKGQDVQNIIFKKRGKGEQADGEGADKGGAIDVGPERRMQSSARWMGISAGLQDTSVISVSSLNSTVTGHCSTLVSKCPSQPLACPVCPATPSWKAASSPGWLIFVLKDVSLSSWWRGLRGKHS